MSEATIEMDKADTSETWDAQQCIKGCGFFGAPWTGGMCSRCYKERDTVFLKLLTDSLSAMDGETPTMSWFQRATSIHLTIRFDDIKNLEAGFNAADVISLQFTSKEKGYKVAAMSLFATCLPARSSIRLTSNKSILKITLVKQKRKWWDKLCTDKAFKNFIKADLSQWCEEDDSEYEDLDAVSAALEVVSATQQAEEDDGWNPRFHAYESVKMMELRQHKPPSSVFDPIDGTRSEEPEDSDKTLEARIPHEFARAAKTICLTPGWKAHSKFLRYLDEMERSLKDDPSLRTQLADPAFFDSLALAIVKHAYRLDSIEAARLQGNPVKQDPTAMMQLPPTKERPFNVLKDLRDTINDAGKVQLAFALQLLLEHERPDALMAKLAEVADRVPRCNAAKKQAFHMIIKHAFQCKERAIQSAPSRSSCSSSSSSSSISTAESASKSSAGEEEAARSHVRDCFEDFLEDHKERAFDSAFVEPTRLYLHSIGAQMPFEVVRQHGVNWYLVLLHTGIGMTIPTCLPDYNDQFELGFADFWAGLDAELWSTFSEPLLFGKDFQAIPKFKHVPFGSGQFVRDPSLYSEFPSGVQTRYPRNVARIVNDKEHQGCAKVRRALAVYLERFAYFFSREYLVRKMIETLNSEVKAEHAGFRKAFAVVFKSFKREFPSVQETSVDEYCYEDEYFTQLDLDKVQKLFGWLGFVKAPKPPDTCQICYEVKADVEVLEHWESAGDISNHKMCAACRASYGKNECPFCKEVLIKDEFLAFISEFTGSLQQNSLAQQQVHSMMEMFAVANRSAQLLERWQLFEMQHDSNSRLVYRVAKLVIDGIASELQIAVRESSDWLRDVAGVVFRLHAFIQAKEVDVAPEILQAFADAIECLMREFEQPVPRDYSIGHYQGDFYGHLYNQVLVAWLCAYRSNSADAVLRKNVSRVGRSIVKCVSWYEARGEKHGIREKAADVMHKEYIKLSHEPCWGSKQDDLVWQKFYASDEDSLPTVVTTTSV